MCVQKGAASAVMGAYTVDLMRRQVHMGAYFRIA